MANTRIQGITAVTIGGDPYDAQEASYDANLTKKTPVFSLGRLCGYKEEPNACSITLTILGNAGVDPSMFQELVNTEVQIVCADGKVVIGTGMFVTETQVVNASENTFEVIFNSNDIFVNLP